jgi:hypothetical protein
MSEKMTEEQEQEQEQKEIREEAKETLNQIASFQKNYKTMLMIADRALIEIATLNGVIANLEVQHNIAPDESKKLYAHFKRRARQDSKTGKIHWSKFKFIQELLKERKSKKKK